jgi:hypothetical protein
MINAAHGALHWGEAKWNQAWENFLKQPGLTPEDAWAFARKLMKENKLCECQLGPYK